MTLTAAIKELGIEIRIMAALATYARDAGADEVIEEFQAARVSDAFDAVEALLGGEQEDAA